MGYRGGLNVTQVNPKRGANLSLAVAQSIPNNADTTIAFDTEDEDTSNYHAPAASSIIIPDGLAGMYVIAAQGAFTGNAVGSRRLSILNNGAVIAGSESDNAGATTTWRASAVVVASLVAGDVLTVTMFQNSGGALNTGAAFNRLQVYRVAA